MKILIYGLRGETYERPGGLQLSNARLANHLASKGHTVTLAAVSPVNRQNLYYPVDESVLFETVPLPRGMKQFDEFQANLRALVERLDPDVVAVLQSGRLMAYVGMAMQDSPVPILATERGEPDYVLTLWEHPMFRSLAFSLCDRIHLLFEAYQRSLPTYLRERCRVIPSPIPSHDHAPARPDEVAPGQALRILYVGRIAYEKDLFTLLRAFALLRADADCTSCRLQIVGDGPLLADLKKEADRLNIVEDVEFAGNKSQDELVPYFQQAHLFVLPSLAEGCPLALREAMSFGLPVVAAWDSKGCSEIFGSAQIGRLVPRIPEEAEIRAQILAQEVPADMMPAERAHRFCETIKPLLEDGQMRRRMGLRGREEVRQYDSDLIHTRWEELLTETASLKGCRVTQRQDKQPLAEPVAETSDHREASGSLEPMADLLSRRNERKVAAKDGRRPQMRILAFLPGLTLGKGGAERVVVELSEAMVARGHQMTLVGFSPNEDATPSYTIPEGVDVVVTRRSVSNVRDKILQTKPDVIFAVTSMAVMRFWHLAFDQINIPVVIQEVSSPGRVIRLWAEKVKISPEQAALLRHAFMGSATKIRLTMPSYAESLPPHFQPDIFAFPNAIKPARRKSRVSAPDKRKTIINIGGLKPNKNIFPLIEAFGNLADEFPEWDLMICGEGRLREEVEAHLQTTGLEDRVTLTGNIDNIYAVYERCHLHVISSLEEGNPLAVCESMVHGIPSIGYADCAGTNEHIRHDINGLLAGNDDRVAALQDCMRALMGDPERRQRLGDQAFLDSRKFESKAIYDIWERLFLAAYAYRGQRSRKSIERAARANELEQLYATLREAEYKIRNRRIADRIKQIYQETREKEAAASAAMETEPTRSRPSPNERDMVVADGNGRVPKILERFLAGRDIRMIRSSEFFDADYYRRQNPDVAAAGIDPAKHYYFHGAREGRNPSEKFNTVVYLYKYPDVRKSGDNPLAHYLKYGKAEGRSPR